MSGVLLDTNAVLLFELSPDSVRERDRAAFAAADRFISQVCAIEIAVKHSLGRLALPAPFETDFARAFEDLAKDLDADILPISLKHIDRLGRLPLFHRDPFDRLIIAQALEDDLTVMSRDRVFTAYPGLGLFLI